VLYQNARPSELDEMVGNQFIIGGLRAILRNSPESRPHTILLEGEPGCGKTTIARILASEFGSTSENIIEYNAANTGGIDTVRKIAEETQVTGWGGGPKTYIIDESHQLTSAAQECLLKITEETGVSQYFILCTTSPESIIKTLMGRCTKYQLAKLGRDEIKQILNNACIKLNIAPDESIFEAIAYTCDGTPREALVSLEMVQGLDLDSALELLAIGTFKDPEVIGLCKLLLMNQKMRRDKWKQILTTFNGVKSDSEVVRLSIMTFMYNNLVKCENQDDAMDMAVILNVFSNTTRYGGKPLLGAMIAKVCLLE